MYVIGIDYGTDSVRSLIVNAKTGEEMATDVFYYPRWAKGLYCDSIHNQFRQHPQDYIDGLETTISNCLKKVPSSVRTSIQGIAVDTTGSTPCAVDKTGTPLALLPGFEENPNAMFVLWKDHTAVNEAQEINTLARQSETNYTKYEGGIYSSEWFWAKILHVHRADTSVRNAAYSWVEHCDWIPFMLSGGTHVHEMKRSRCAAGHKALWHPSWDGLPPNAFFAQLDPLLDGMRNRLFEQTYTSDESVGALSSTWAERLGLSEEVVVAVGAFDAHMGAVGGQIEPYYLSKVMGTSTCDILVAPSEEVAGKLVHGICGQVNGSVIPGMEGLEAGQSAFGDVYAWFSKLLSWPLTKVIQQSKLLDDATKAKLIEEALDQIIPALSEAAASIKPTESGVIALDWLNGRRTPDANQRLKGAIFGLSLGSDAPTIFRALVEATCFGARKIVDRFRDEGIPVKGLIGLGGVAKKSPFVMQVMADVMNMPIKIAKSEQSCALGAAMFAATAAGMYTRVEDAIENMGSGFDAEYHPDAERNKVYEHIYAQYNEFGNLIEKLSQA